MATKPKRISTWNECWNLSVKKRSESWQKLNHRTFFWASFTPLFGAYFAESWSVAMRPFDQEIDFGSMCLCNVLFLIKYKTHVFSRVLHCTGTVQYRTVQQVKKCLRNWKYNTVHSTAETQLNTVVYSEFEGTVPYLPNIHQDSQKFTMISSFGSLQALSKPSEGVRTLIWWVSGPTSTEKGHRMQK